MKKALTTVFLVAVFCMSPRVCAEQLTISEERMSELGVEIQNIIAVSSIWSRSFPAEIVIPNAQVRVVNPMLSGLVSALFVAEGDAVKKGQILAEVASPGYLELQQEFIAAHSSYELIKRNHLRNEELLEEGIISEKSYLASEADQRQAEADLSTTIQSLEFSGLTREQIDDLAKKGTLNKNMTIPAPFDGFVLKQIASAGEHVDEDVALYHLGILNPLWIEVHVPYALRPSLEMGSEISIEGIDETSRVVSIGKMVHSDDQGILVRGNLDNTSGKLIPGQFVKARLEQKNQEGSLYRLPTGALVRNGNLATIFVKNQQGFSTVNVMIVAEQGEALFIAADLSGNEQIAVKGIATLKGMLEGLGGEE